MSPYSRATTHRPFLWIVIVGLLWLAGCREVDLRWSEEVQLASGHVIVVQRTARGEKLVELGGPGGWEQKEMSLAINPPATRPKPPEWRSAYVPVLLDHDESENRWSIVATFYTC